MRIFVAREKSEKQPLTSLTPLRLLNSKASERHYKCRTSERRKCLIDNLYKHVYISHKTVFCLLWVFRDSRLITYWQLIAYMQRFQAALIATV